MWMKIRDIDGLDVCIVGVSRNDDKWVIAAYKTHANYVGPPQFYFFNDDGVFLKSMIIV